LVIQVVLQDNRRRGRVKPDFATPPVTFPHGQSRLSLVTGQTLVLKDHGHGDSGSEGADKGFDEGREMGG
jgi:hypothetical protein